MKILPFCLLILSVLTFVGCSDASEQKYKKQLKGILNIADISDEKNIPKLEEYLKSNDGSIHKYAAAQALFLMDTSKGRDALEKYMFSPPNYDFSQSINYMFHWGMKPITKRNEFIKKYHLRSSSNLISLTLKSSYPTEFKDKINFELTLKNRSGKPIRLNKPHLYLGQHILLMSSTGEFMKPVFTAMYKLRRRAPEEGYVEVPPAGSYIFNFSGHLKTFPNSPSKRFREGLWLDCGDFMHKLSHAGSFKVYGVYSNRASKQPPYDNIWIGRVVSKPIDITLNQEE
ncbi:MAG: hypothetical protein KAS17_07455 [Victivallaceae bacterium]|nr:hypothetical protein [Victivallaceae bacterium]